MGNASVFSENNYLNTTENIQKNEILKDNNLLSKIDELLNNNGRNKTNRKSINSVYDDYLKKSMTNSSGSIPNKSAVSESPVVVT